MFEPLTYYMETPNYRLWTHKYILLLIVIMWCVWLGDETLSPPWIKRQRAGCGLLQTLPFSAYSLIAGQLHSLIKNTGSKWFQSKEIIYGFNFSCSQIWTLPYKVYKEGCTCRRKHPQGGKRNIIKGKLTCRWWCKVSQIYSINNRTT